LSDSQFSKLESVGINDPKGQEKYINNTEVKYGATAVSQHLTPAVVKYKNLDKVRYLESKNHNKIK
jgi:hypothetical protein